MNENELAFLPIEELAPLIRRKQVSPVELVRMLLARIEQIDRRPGGPLLNAYLTVAADRAMAQARRAERDILSGRYHGPLHGVPISIKDNIWTRGIRTTAGSKILADFVPPEDAPVVQFLRRAGAIVLGKTNLHEFAYGVTNENPHYGATRNPWDTTRITGGSSGGSAAAIAAGLCYASVGSDTGGSIRIPAGLCGVVGLKPTFGRVSAQGVVPLSRTLDHVGPLARTVGDAAALLTTIAGPGALGPNRDYAGELRKPRRIRLGWPREYFFNCVDNEVVCAVETARHVLESLGAVIKEVSLPLLMSSDEPATKIALAEAREYHESQGYFPARAAEYGEDVRKRLEMGADVRATEYVRALEVRRKLQFEFLRLGSRVDALVAPTTPIAAPPIGAKLITIGSREEPVRGALLRLNRPANFTGAPAISIPCGLTRGGLPIGLQLIGTSEDEGRLLRIACAYERATEWHRQHPPLAVKAAFISQTRVDQLLRCD